jgi:hypothetical protein
MPVIMALVKLRQENCKFEANLGYIVRPYLKKMKEGKAGGEGKRERE